ncbi:MAG: hypothetical protein IJ647_01890 [Prevotella sp.]|nr:hypothetical protein [Prevotella sp.]
MKYKEYRKYVSEKSAELERYAEILLVMEGATVDNLAFAEAYVNFLTLKLECLRVVTRYYNEMYANSFWFMKPKVAKRIRAIGIEHSITLHNLLNATMYKDYQQKKLNND